MRYQRILITGLSLALLILGVMFFGQSRHNPHLAYAVFRVVDAETHAPIPEFALTFPQLSSQTPVRQQPQESTFLRGPDFSVIMSVAPRPATISISKDGYQDASFDILPRQYVSEDRLLPGEVRIIALSKKNKN